MPPALTAAEKEIGRRLKIAREARLIPLRRLAAGAGINHSTLASVEKGRTALMWDAFTKLGAKLNVNPFWLWRGEKDMDTGYDHAVLELRFDDGTRFSSAMEQLSARPYAALYSEDWAREFAEQHLPSEEQILATLSRLDYPPEAAPHIHAARAELAKAARAMRNVIERLAATYPSIKELRDQSTRKNSLAVSNPFGLHATPMPFNFDSVEALIEALTSVLKVKGRKADLARYLGVKPHRVTDWIAKRRRPGLAHALSISEWMGQLDRAENGGSIKKRKPARRSQRTDGLQDQSR